MGSYFQDYYIKISLAASWRFHEEFSFPIRPLQTSAYALIARTSLNFAFSRKVFTSVSKNSTIALTYSIHTRAESLLENSSMLCSLFARNAPLAYGIVGLQENERRWKEKHYFLHCSSLKTVITAAWCILSAHYCLCPGAS
jgi:hypothetical protein